MLPIGEGNTRFSVRFLSSSRCCFSFCFDIEVVFSYPWAVGFIGRLLKEKREFDFRRDGFRSSEFCFVGYILRPEERRHSIGKS